ncbi:MAG TPA: ABC transporter permease subunit, partial [Ktedonobacterales bacterium]|nr:ABC transporter permease subunit [Ktedonobacterales bacterium]
MMSTLSLSRVPSVTPGSGLLAAVGQVWAVMWAELTMQWRRWGFWVTFAGVTLLLLLLTVQTAIYFKHPPSDSLYVSEHFTSIQIINVMTYGTTAYGAMFFGLVAALLVVDRMGRDQRLGMFELQRATPQGYARYILGKFLGNAVA